MPSSLLSASLPGPSPETTPPGMALASSGSRKDVDERSLAKAFAGFAAVAASLERSYGQLQSEVARLRHQLEDRNRALAESLEENRNMRQHLDRILEGLPCGVLVIEAGQRVSIANPEARRLLGALGGAPGESPISLRRTCASPGCANPA